MNVSAGGYGPESHGGIVIPLEDFTVEMLPCSLGILAPCLCRPVAAPKALGYLRSDFSQLADKSVNLFAPFSVPAKTEPNDRWKRPHLGLERPDRSR